MISSARRLMAISGLAAIATGLTFYIVSSIAENPRTQVWTPEIRACAIPRGPSGATWSRPPLTRTHLDSAPFFGLDIQWRYLDSKNTMHAGNWDEIMTVYSLDAGLWGLQYECEAEHIRVIDALPRLPLYDVGVRKDDRIVSIDGTTVAGKSKLEIAALLRSRPSASFVIMRGDERLEFTVEPVN